MKCRVCKKNYPVSDFVYPLPNSTKKIFWQMCITCFNQLPDEIERLAFAYNPFTPVVDNTILCSPEKKSLDELLEEIRENAIREYTDKMNRSKIRALESKIENKGTCCDILEQHHTLLADDPDRLSTEFIKRLSHCSCDTEQ